MASDRKRWLALGLVAGLAVGLAVHDLLDDDDRVLSRSASPVWITTANETLEVVIPGGNVPSLVTPTRVRVTSEAFEVAAGTERLELSSSSRGQFYVEVRASATDAWSGTWALTTGHDSWFSMVDLPQGGQARITVQMDGELFQQDVDLQVSSQRAGIVRCYQSSERAWCDQPVPVGDEPEARIG